MDLLADLDTRWLLTGLLMLLDSWAIGMIVTARASRRDKMLWSAVVALCPIIGCLFWYVLGPKTNLGPPTRASHEV
ncbi:MAG: PLD nuclease N-terminal domain-containing protein [Gemmatimonadota bacterium]